ncbi:MAG: serine hydrolase domain-containing protein [Sphingomonas sp.]
MAASAAIALLCGTAAEARGVPQQRAAVQEASLRRLQSVLDAYVREHKLCGVVAAVGRGTAAPSFVYAGRLSDDPGAPAITPDSLWRIYSMTKPITAMAAMLLVEEGKLHLDQPISDFIPAFKNVRVMTSPETSLDSRPARHPITVRELLTHTSGLGYQILGTGPLPKEYERLHLLGGRVAGAANDMQPNSLGEFADKVATVPLRAEPGTEWNYSISLDILGRVIEVASGEPFDHFVDERILTPIGMTSTYWTVPKDQAGRLATAYIWRGDRKVPIDTGSGSDWLHPPKAPYGGSGLVSSARDYDRFLQMLAGHGSIGGVRVLKAETVRLAMSNLLPPGVQITSNITPAPVMAQGFGAGGELFLNDVPNGVGAGTFGWFGAAGTIGFFDPRKNLRVTVMVNYFPGDKWPLYADVVRALYSDGRQ